jgi:hypothetical protein
MEYQGYIGKVDFDDEAAVFHGEVKSTRDVITFQGEFGSSSTRRAIRPRQNPPDRNPPSGHAIRRNGSSDRPGSRGGEAAQAVIT